MTLKLLATGVVALATIGAAAVGVTSIASVDKNVPQTQLAAFGAPSPASGRYPPPLDPAPLPSPGDLVGVLNGLQDPSVPFGNKSNLSFINDDGWKLSRSSAMTLLQSVSG